MSSQSRENLTRLAVGAFFIVTGLAICLAGYQTYQVLSWRSKAEVGGAIGELLLVIVLGIGEILAFFGLRHTAKERELQILLKAQEVWTDREFRELRSKMFQRLRVPSTSWTPQDADDGREVCRRMDEFARLAPFLGVDEMLDTWDDPLAKAWLVLEPIVNEERTKYAMWLRKWKGFEVIGKRALEKLVREGRNPSLGPSRSL
jgi:hypothetical protein